MKRSEEFNSFIIHFLSLLSLMHLSFPDFTMKGKIHLYYRSELQANKRQLTELLNC